MSGVPFSLTAAEQTFLGAVVCNAITARLSGTPAWDAATVAAQLTPTVQRTLGAFVTLHRGGQLRGCIGNIIAHDPLWRVVQRMAQAAAFEDTRFPPLQAAEWPDVTLEISVLGPLTPCPDPDAVEIGRHGLLLTYAGRSGIFLPQVPVEQGWDLPAYLTHLCAKAGVPAGSWQHPDAQLYWYEAFVFPVERTAS